MYLYKGVQCMRVYAPKGIVILLYVILVPLVSFCKTFRIHSVNVEPLEGFWSN